MLNGQDNFISAITGKRQTTIVEGKGLGLNSIDADTLYPSVTFPYDDLARWIESAFSQGYSYEFVPGSQRNIQGLAAWAFGNEDEPYWPGSDDK